MPLLRLPLPELFQPIGLALLPILLPPLLLLLLRLSPRALFWAGASTATIGSFGRDAWSGATRDNPTQALTGR